MTRIFRENSIQHIGTHHYPGQGRALGIQDVKVQTYLRDIGVCAAISMAFCPFGTNNYNVCFAFVSSLAILYCAIEINSPMPSITNVFLVVNGSSRILF